MWCSIETQIQGLLIVFTYRKKLRLKLTSYIRWCEDVLIESYLPKKICEVVNLSLVMSILPSFLRTYTNGMIDIMFRVINKNINIHTISVFETANLTCVGCMKILK